MWPHYLDLKQFPFYYALNLTRDVQTGAAVGKMFCDYFAMDDYPDGEVPDQYDQQWIYDNFTGFAATPEMIAAGLDYYEDPDHIDMIEMWLGLAWNTYQWGPSWWGHANVSSDPILKTICVMTDYTIPATAGHLTHVGAALPFYGSYDDWVAIRGIHTDKATYPPPGSFEIYGFWINDLRYCGIGENTYKTFDELLATYYAPMDLPSGFEDDKYVAIVEPPEGFQGLSEDIEVEYGEAPGGYTHQASNKFPIMIYSAAKDAVSGIFELDGRDLDTFTPRSITYVKSLVGPNYRLVVFDSQDETLVVSLHARTGQLKEFAIGDYEPEYLKGVKFAIFEGGSSAFHPTG
jgi:hypothetical protein